jgi:hypothetical protein
MTLTAGSPAASTPLNGLAEETTEAGDQLLQHSIL